MRASRTKAIIYKYINRVWLQQAQKTREEEEHISHHRPRCFPLESIIHCVDPRVEHLRPRSTEIVPRPPTASAPPLHDSFRSCPTLSSYLTRLTLLLKSPPSKPRRSNPIGELSQDKAGIARSDKPVPGAYQNGGKRKGAYAYQACEERGRGASCEVLCW